MAINKNFVVKNGLEVADNLLLVDQTTGRVGISSTNPQYKLDVDGDIAATSIDVENINVTGISTLSGVTISGISTLIDLNVVSTATLGSASIGSGLTVSGAITVGGTTGNENYYLTSTGTGVTWSSGLGVSFTTGGTSIGYTGPITNINFTGAAVTVTSAGAYGVNVDIFDIINPPGKTIYVAMNGIDTNTGLTIDYPKRTIEAAVGIASTGDTVKVSPGTYVENNPIVVPENVSIEGAELRNCIVTPQNPASDLFWVTNGTHITDLSFQGQTATGNSAVIAFKPLVGVASDRFFDAARMLRYNLDFIASETAAYISSTAYQNPAVAISTSDYKNYITNTYLAVCHDIVRGGNSKCVGVGLSFYTGGVLNVGIGSTTIDALNYSAGIARSCINNVLWDGNYQTQSTQIRDLSIQGDGVYGNQNINSCSNVVSAIYSCVGVVTSIIGVGTGAVGTLFNLTYPGNAGIGTTNPNDIPSQGVGLVTKGPYIRNCTNFIPNSVGMRVDGFHADPGDKVDMGIQGMMSVDSYTQYNQGGVGVEVTNGAYSQLVSIFTICNDTAIKTENGGQCDITNSNSSFGTNGLVSDGTSGPTSKSPYRYTANVSSASTEGDLSVTISGVGTERPHSGQVVYFEELYYEIESVSIINGGSGYTEPPSVIFTTNTDPINGNPSGPSAIKAEAIAQIENGSVTSVSMIGNGRNYRILDNAAVTFTSPDAGVTATASVNLKPIYYQVRAATLPNSGISTITIAQPLNNNIGVGTTAFLSRQSLQIVSSHSFEYIGAGNTIEIARPSKGGVTIRDNEVVKINGGEVVYTSTDQDGNFAIGDELIINQATGTIEGRLFERGLLNIVTPLIIALGAK